ncbi:expansin EXLX1 family cellulose-binding protein [Nonomuraea sp. NPDC049152]|uniref:expansin EXLX1 family cellulose-binding protein n=1 Tax=Nonomuraea sp. NPDC049152 TaxID=3154350 RepID=UPI003408BB32
MVGRHARHGTWRRRGAAGAAAIVALAVALLGMNLLRAGGCAAADVEPTRTGTAVDVEPTRSGTALHYQGEAGNCSITGAELYASVSVEEYAGSEACGGYLDVKGPRGTVRVEVVDSCPTCRSGELDLSTAAFSRIADPRSGVARVAYHSVRDPELGRGLAFRVRKGSTAGWLALQVLDHGNPLRKVEVRGNDDWRDLERGSDGYWVASGGAGAGPFDLRVTDVHDQRATVEGVDLAPDEIQRTTTRLYGTAPASASPAPNPLAAEHVRGRC